MARKQYDNPKAEMTPMIDVVFQLMIFFIVTIKQEDIFSKLNANRPAPNASSAQSEENDTQIKIDIGPRGVVFNGRGMSFKMLDDNIKKLAASSTKSNLQHVTKEGGRRHGYDRRRGNEGTARRGDGEV